MLKHPQLGGAPKNHQRPTTGLSPCAAATSADHEHRGDRRPGGVRLEVNDRRVEAEDPRGPSMSRTHIRFQGVP
jgi:hypothetical protein